MNTIGSGDVVVPTTGLNQSAGLIILADNLSDGDNDLTLAATDANITLRDGAADQTWNTSFDSLTANIVGAGALTVVDNDALTVNGLTTGGAADISSTGADLTFTAAPNVAGGLALNTIGSGDVLVPTTGLNQSAGLTILADNLSDGDNDLTLAATDANITLRDGAANQIWNTSFDSLSADITGTGALTVVDSNALTLTALNTGGAANISSTAGDLTLSSTPNVGGDLTLTTITSGDLIVADAGLTQSAALTITADNLRDSDNEVTLSATNADISLRDGATDQIWNTSFDSLTANIAGVGALSLVDSDALIINALNSAGAANITASNADLTLQSNPSVVGDLQLTATGLGDIVMPNSGLVHSGNLLLSAAHIVDGDNSVSLSADNLTVVQSNGDNDAVFNTDVNRLDLTYAGASSVSVNEANALQIAQLIAGGETNVTAAGDMTLLANIDVPGRLSLQTTGAGTLTLLDSGLSTSGDLLLDVAALRDSDQTVTLGATAADIQLRDQQLALTLNSAFNQLSLSHSANSALQVVQAGDLTLNQLSAGGDVSISGNGNLSVLQASPAVVGNLALVVADTLTIADSGLQLASDLQVDAGAVTTQSGSGITQWQAQNASLRIRNGVQNNALNTLVNNLSLTYDGATPLSVDVRDATSITGLSAASDLALNSAGDLQFLVSSSNVDGLLSVQAAGDVEVPGAGFSVLDALRVNASNFVSSNGGAVTLSGNHAELNLSGDQALALSTQLAQLGLNYAAAGDLSVNNDGNLQLTDWQVANAANVALAVTGTLQIPESGLNAGTRLNIDALDLTDGDRTLDLSAPQLVVRLSNSSDNNIWNVASDQVDALVRGSANLNLIGSRTLTLQDLNSDGLAADVNDGNFSVLLSDGDLIVDNDVSARDQTADGQRTGIVDLTVASGDIQVGLSGDVNIVSRNSLDNDVNSSAGGQNGIRFSLTDASANDRQIVLGNGTSSVNLLAVGGDIELNARPVGGAEDGLRAIVQNDGVFIDAYNNPGDPLTGTVLINGNAVTAKPWQRIREDRTLALVTDYTSELDLDDVLDEVDDIDDSVVIEDEVQEPGANAAKQFDNVFGRCDELEKNGSQRCRVDTALKAFLSHWLVGGEMPPKSEI